MEKHVSKKSCYKWFSQLDFCRTVRLNTNTPVYVLEFTLSAMQDVKESTYEIELGKSSDVPSAMNFKEKVSVIVKQIMRDAQF